MKLVQILKMSFFVALSVIFTAVIVSFKSNDENLATVYYYISADTSEGAFADPLNWSTSGTVSCMSEGNKPCNIIISDETTLEEHISGLSNAQVLAINPNDRRP